MTERDHLENEMRRSGSALRALAWALVGDAHTAEDLVQETWRSSLQRPPAHTGSLTRWFAAVLRNLAKKHHRGEARRSLRERRAARAERIEGVDEIAVRRETLRRVVDALLTLDEPYQSTLMLRYFEGLTPAKIAERTGVKLATVKSRLQRGLRLLRAKLGDERDGRGAALLPFVFGTQPMWRSMTLMIGGSLMSKGLKLALALFVLLFGGSVAVWLNASDRAPTLDASVTDARGAPAAPSVGEHRDGLARAQREMPPAGTDSWVGFEHPYEYELTCRVIDEFGLPLQGANVEIAPAGGQLDAAPGETDADGVLTIRWRGKRKRMDIDIGLGGGEGLRRLTVSAGGHRLFLGGGMRSCTGCHGGSGSGRRTLEVVVRRSRVRLNLVGGCAASHVGSSDKAPMEAGLHPFARFTDATKATRASVSPGTAEVQLVTLGGGGISNVRGVLKSVTLDGARLESKPAKQAEPKASVTGVVMTPDGKPAACTVVTWRKPSGAFENRVLTDENGKYRLEVADTGTIELRAGGGDAGLRLATLPVVRGQTTRWDPMLRRGAAIFGRAVAEDGASLAGWSVEYDGTDTPWFDACTVAEDGSFVLPNLPRGLSRLLLWDKNAARRLPVLAEVHAFPDAGGYVLRPAAKTIDGTLRVSVAVPDATVAKGLQARIWQESTRRGTTLRRRKDGAFECKRLVADRYRVEVRSNGIGWTEVARTWVDGNGVNELNVSLPEPGRLVLEGVDPKSPPELYVRRADVDVRATGAPADGATLLLPGDYWCLWKGTGRSPRHLGFSIRAGETTRVSLR